MKKFLKKVLIYSIMGVIMFEFYTHFLKAEQVTKDTHVRNYEEIVQSGVLRAVTEYNSLSYHAKDDTIGGFHYELLQAFARAKNLKIEITPEMSLEKRFIGLENGTYDILANNVLKMSDRKDSILYTLPILLSKLVLVQRKAQNETDSCYINSLLELGHKTLHIVKDSPFMLRIQNLSNEIGDTIYIKEIELYGPEQLIAMVANGDIDYTVCDESTAKASIKNFPQIDIEKAISFTQFYTWGVNKKNTTLLDTLNAWIEEYKSTKTFKELNKKYNNH